MRDADELPTGTVTFLLTDIEGSTALWEQSPTVMQAALARHDLMVMEAIEAHCGVVVKQRGEGDSVFAVFRSAIDAVAAASAVQRVLAAEPWPTPRPIKVRIGLHTGEAQVRGGDYFGSVVNRCARLRGIGHGGQILLSETTAALVRETLPPDTMLADLGLHRLKNLARPERVAQLTVLTLQTAFPPLASLDVRPHNLPIQATPFIGRIHELHAVRTLLARNDVRLVTLTGPGGTGKTRLALQAAAELVDVYTDGVYVVELASIADPALVVPTIAQALHVTPGDGRPLLDGLTEFLGSRHLLLVLDNFEQVLSAASGVDSLLHGCPGLTILVTSRAPLQLRGEHEFPVSPLAVPDPRREMPPERLSQYEAVELFVERATAIKPDFTVTTTNAPAVAEICARLDGLPLAIELAAARLRLLSPEAMLPRLGHGLRLLAGGRRDLPARQQTLRQTIAWSYDLLSSNERRLFRQLSVFVGGFTLEAAATVCQTAGAPGLPEARSCQAGPPADIDVLDGIGALVDHSLLRPGGSDDEPRFAMLETIREYGLVQLEASGEADDVRQRHMAWCLDLTTRAAQHMNGPRHGEWLDRLDADYDNLRAALRCAEENTCDVTSGLQLASSLVNFWLIRGYHREARDWLARLITRSTARSALRAGALDGAGFIAVRQNDYQAAVPYFEEALAIWRALDDRRGLARTLLRYGVVPHHLGDFPRARQMLQESLALCQELGHLKGVEMALHYLGDLARDGGNDAEAVTTYRQSLDLARRHGNTHGEAYALRGLGLVARAQGRYAQAAELLHESLRLLQALRDRRCIPLCLEGLACMAVGPDWAERATRLLAAAQAIQSATGAPAPPSELADYQRTAADARRALGTERFAGIWSEGAAMPLDTVIAYALGDAEAGEPAASPAGDSSLRPMHTPAPAASPVSAPEHPAASLPLSARERLVVALIAEGLSNRQIAEQLVISVRTVERHIENVYNRLGISGKAGRAIVTAYAIRHRLTESA